MPNSRKTKDATYIRRFIEFSERWERYIRIAIIVSVCLLVFFQALLQLPEIRVWLTTVDALEGVQANWE